MSEFVDVIARLRILAMTSLGFVVPDSNDAGITADDAPRRRLWGERRA
jgi:hypothetical protein